MSKTSKRKSSESGKQNDNRTAPSSKDQGGTAVVKRQSVFERLGTKAASSGLSSERNLSVNTAIPDGFCRSWAQNGTCSFDKTCKLAHSHALISPSKRSASIKKEELIISPLSRRQIEEEKNRLLSSIKHQSPDVSTWENWDQTELEYEDEKVLEKRRAALQRELELQMKKDGSRKEVVKARRSSSTSSLSSTSSVSSSSSSSSRSSVSVTKKTEDKKRRTSSSPEPDKKKLVMKGGSHKDSPPRKMSSASSRDVERAKGKSSASSPMRQPQSRKRSISPPRKPSPKTKGSDPYKGITLEVTLKNELALRANAARRKESPIRRGVSSDRRSRRSNSRNRRRSPVARSTVARRSRPRSPSRPSTSSRARTPERKKEDERKKDDRRDRKNDYRDKKESHDDSRGRGKTRDLREVAREKERFEALERCRERQREREQKEKERLREERERKDSKRSSRDISRGSTASSDKRPERYDRFDRGKGERDRSYERERVRDRALERMMERKSVERTRERSRERYGDRGNYSESRRLLQPEEKPYASSPYRAGGERNRYDAERERLSPREERIGRGGYADDRRDRGRSRGWPDNQPASQPTRYEESGRERDKPRSSGDWAGDRGGDFPEPSGSRNREWDSSRVRDEGDDWSGYDRGAPPDWHNRPHALHHHIDDRRERRHGSGSKEKDPHTPIDSSKDKESVENIGKRPGPIDDNDEPVKRPRLSEPALEELSDISDDLDDILNQDDGPDGHDSRMGDSSAAINDTSSGQGERADAHVDDSSQASPNARMGDEENNMDGLDFEEISDEELEEELKVNKGGSVGDALGVDWASLVAECRPQKKKLEENGVSSVRARWEPAGILARVGVSSSLASPEYLKKLREKFPQLAPGISSEKETSPRSVLGMVALQRKMADRKEKRESIIAISMENKQALSARADIAIRRRLCGLPVVSLETYHTTGFCPWAV